jgi:hypothetical protein
MLPKFVLVVLLVAAPLVAAPTLAFVVTDLSDGREILCRQVRPGDAIVLSFTNSMYGGDVREEFAATTDGRLRRVGMTTANAAAADYYAYTSAVVAEDGRFRIDVPTVALGEIVVRADRVGRHRIAIGTDVVDLLTKGGAGRPVRLRIERTMVWDRLLGGAC